MTTSAVVAAKFIGGPLDGETRTAPLLRELDDSGVATSNRYQSSLDRAIADGRTARTGYRHAYSDAKGTHSYVHGSVYCRWANDPTEDEAATVGVQLGCWPYGPNIDPLSRRQLVDWATVNSYRLAVPRRRCVHWVIGQARRCGALQDTSHDGMMWSGGLFDHLTFWTGPAGRFALAQPYPNPDREGYAEFASRWPVDVEIMDEAPWYGAGTFGVIIRAAAAPQA